MALPFETIRAASIAQLDRLLRDWFPHGRTKGREFTIGNLRGDPGESLSINLDTGKWADFATGESGFDPIDLRAAIIGKRPSDAALDLAQMLGVEANAPANGKDHKANGKDHSWHPIIPPPANTPPPDERKFAGYGSIYQYCDADDRTLLYVRRKEGTVTENKTFHPLVFGILNGVTGWHARHPVGPLPLYGLNRLSTMPNAHVLLCEGEKAADAAQRLFPDYACISWMGGTSRAKDADLAPLRSRFVIIWPDNDDAGHKACKHLLERLPGALVLRVLDLPVGADAADVHPDDPDAWLAARLSKAAVSRIVSRIVSGSDFLSTFTPPDYVVDGIIQRGRIYACTSITGHGKTAVFLYVGCMLASRRFVGHLRTTGGAVVYLAGENPDDFCGRLHAACEAYGLRPDRLPHVLPRNFPVTADEAETLKREIDTLGVDVVLVVVDTAAAFYPGDDSNDNVQQGAYARNLRLLCGCRGKPAVVVLSHPIKAADQNNLLPLGGGAFVNELDGNLTLWSDAIGESTTLHWHKKLRGADFDPFPFILRQAKVEHLRDTWDRPFVTILAEPQSPESAAHDRSMAITDENAVLVALADSPGATHAEIAQRAGWVNDAGVPNKAKVHRHLVELRREKLVRHYRKTWQITDAGKKEIGRAKGGFIDETV